MTVTIDESPWLWIVRRSSMGHIVWIIWSDDGKVRASPVSSSFIIVPKATSFFGLDSHKLKNKIVSRYGVVSFPVATDGNHDIKVGYLTVVVDEVGSPKTNPVEMTQSKRGRMWTKSYCYCFVFLPSLFLQVVASSGSIAMSFSFRTISRGWSTTCLMPMQYMRAWRVARNECNSKNSVAELEGESGNVTQLRPVQVTLAVTTTQLSMWITRMTNQVDW